MKTFRIIISVAAMLVFMVSTAFITNCDNDLEHIISFFKKTYSKDKIYVKYTSYNIQDNEQGEKLENEVWVYKGKIKISNAYMTLYQDAQTQVTILKSSKLLFIKNLKEANGNLAGDISKLSPGEYIDSLKRFAKSIQCKSVNGLGIITIVYPETANRKPMPLEQMNIYFDPKDHSVKKTEMMARNSNSTEVYEYKVVSNDLDPKVMEGTVLSKVYLNGALRKEFEGYTIRDFRLVK
ncbi:hypothetical protein MYP_2869 [Sporocytophaga myxococcoides]|uniref:Outer membrane lipoprotein-sorting protein n=1 Tax=Sporocytophaga myxococcoides TaxID=153721 RepID=A0A098LF96_9BACT|nr:hypothetical protein [Sporocytophaga myxococcoides]GAL85640.1 hypothetical protein MYP_2869 [Sporocytophaga myxococcoides]